jgi:hypothetical protein
VKEPETGREAPMVIGPLRVARLLVDTARWLRETARRRIS